jgi:chemotaxis protein MotB
MLAGCSSHIKKLPASCTSEGWSGYLPGRVCSSEPNAVVFPEEEIASQLTALKRERDWLVNNEARLAVELEVAKRQNIELERRVDLSRTSLVEAKQDLLQALQPEIASGAVSVQQSGEALTIYLASNLLFDPGQDQLKAGGTDALRRVGRILKDFPDKQVHVSGYTDNMPIRSALKKKYPTNQELSDARARCAAQALSEGGVSSRISFAGHGDSHPVASNETAVGRAKNRRVEIIVS